jgi:hypothetical protein
MNLNRLPIVRACSLSALAVVSCDKPINTHTLSANSTPPSLVEPPAAAREDGERNGDFAEIAEEQKRLRLQIAHIDAEMNRLPEDAKMTPFDLGAMTVRRDLVERQIRDLTEERRKLRLATP